MTQGGLQVNHGLPEAFLGPTPARLWLWLHDQQSEIASFPETEITDISVK